MTRREAEKLVAGLGWAYGARLELTSGGFAGFSAGLASLFFEYDDGASELECSALIHKFREPPRPGLIECLRAAEARGTDTAHGALVYEPQNKGVYLSRTYQHAIDEATFLAEMQALLRATSAWASEVLPRIAEQGPCSR